MFDSQGNFLFHGQEWKRHKYIRKEGDRYIYADDVNSHGGSGGGHRETPTIMERHAARRKVVAPSAPNPARTATIATRNINSVSGGGGSKPSSRAGMPSDARRNSLSGSRAGMPTNLGNRSTAKKEVPKTNNGYGGEYTARSEVQKVINKIPKENRRVVSRTTSATSGDYRQTVKDGNGNVISSKRGNTFRDNSNSGRATAMSEMKKGRAKVAGREASEKTTNWVNQKNAEREAKNKKIQENNPKGYYGRVIRKAKEKSESYSQENEKMMKKLGADSVNSSISGEGAHYYKNGKEVKYNGVADTERTKGEAIEKKNNTIGNRIKKTAKNVANSYDELHERQSDALIRATENGKNKVKSLLENAKKKQEEAIKNTLEKAIGGKEASLEVNGERVTVGYRNGKVTVKDSHGNRMDAEYKDGKIIAKNNHGDTINIGVTDLVKKK